MFYPPATAKALKCSNEKEMGKTKYFSFFFQVHPTLLKWYRSTGNPPLMFEVSELPMLCPPIPWVDTKRAGYLLASSKFLAVRQAPFPYPVVSYKPPCGLITIHTMLTPRHAVNSACILVILSHMSGRKNVHFLLFGTH